jgi:hypothetical protein
MKKTCEILKGLEPRNCVSNLCADCGVPVSMMNSEGWEVFVGDGKQTQLICNRCMAVRDEKPIIKAGDYESDI